MDKEVTRNHRRTFNGPLDAGLRAVALLAAAYPRSYDLQRLIGLDYLLVHTEDIGGPKSLHPPVRLQSAELLVRRKVIENALLLMMTRDLVQREVVADGIRYRAGENAAPFMSSLASEYVSALKERAGWLIENLGDRSDHDFRAIIHHFFDQWVEEFQAADSSAGVD